MNFNHVITNLSPAQKAKVIYTHGMHESASELIFAVFQLNPDCADDVPPDYETSVGGPPTNPISGASEITVNESSVVLDPAGRVIGLQQLHSDAEAEPQEGEENHIVASSKSRHHSFKTLS